MKWIALVLASCFSCVQITKAQCFPDVTDCGLFATSFPTGTFAACCDDNNGMSFRSLLLFCTVCPDPVCYTEDNSCSSGATSTPASANVDACCDALGGMSYQSPTGVCTACPEMAVGQDPHFAVPLSSGQQLCYSMQGLADFIFNLISDPVININAYFVYPSQGKNLSEYATFLGDVGIMFQPDYCKGSCQPEDITKISISSGDRSVSVRGSKTVLTNRPVHVLVDNTTTTVYLGDVIKKGEHPSLIVSVKKPMLSFKVMFVDEHLDLIVLDESGISKDCHGIMGQFLNKQLHIESDNVQINGRQIIVEEKPGWDFLHAKASCLHAKPHHGYQAEGIIEGKYTDYIVESLFSPWFQYSKFKF